MSKGSSFQQELDKIRASLYDCLERLDTLAEFCSPEENSSSSSSSSEEEEQVKKRPRDSFVVDDDDDSPSKRSFASPRLLIESDSDSESDNLDSSSSSCSLVESSPHDTEELKLFLRQLKSYDLESCKNDWWNTQFGNALSKIREGIHAKALDYYDAIPEATRKDKAELKDMHRQESCICCLCNQKKPCRKMLHLTGFLKPAPIASCCGKLAQALIDFYETLYLLVRKRSVGDEDFKDLSERMLEVMEAHAGKGSNGRA